MKNILNITLIALITIFIASCTKSELIDEEIMINGKTQYNSVILYAGQNIEAGELMTEISGNQLYVTYNTANGFGLKEVHLFVGTSMDNMPQTKTGNPKIGQFPYTALSLGGLTTYTFSIPLSELGIMKSAEIFIAAHAVVENGAVNETAWADGDLISDGSWATYFSIRYKPKVKPEQILKEL